MPALDPGDGAGGRAKDLDALDALAGAAQALQFASGAAEAYARRKGYLALFEETGVKVIHPGCGACIGCGPGVSERASQVTVSAINRNFKGRSGPGMLYLASPLTVAASAVEGRIVSYRVGMFTALGK